MYIRYYTPNCKKSSNNIGSFALNQKTRGKCAPETHQGIAQTWWVFKILRYRPFFEITSWDNMLDTYIWLYPNALATEILDNLYVLSQR